MFTRKTNFILFGNKKHTGDVHISINNVKIDRVYVTKFLGVMIDHNLNWKEHSKISKSIAIIYKASKILETDSLYTLYCSLFLPYLNSEVDMLQFSSGACTSGKKHETFILYVFWCAEFKSVRHPALSLTVLRENPKNPR